MELDKSQLRETVEVCRTVTTQRAAAAILKISQGQVCKRLKRAKKLGLVLPDEKIFFEGPGGRVDVLSTEVFPLPAEGEVKRYLFTCAQDDTKLHPVWHDLKALAAHYGAEIMVSTFRYNKEAYGQSNKAKNRRIEAESNAGYPPEIVPYIRDERIDLAPGLTWCGELQISPTNRRPLSGFEQYTYRKSSIIPHTTLALKSVASLKHEGTKLLYSTGACTQRNYIQRREGFRAEHFHAYGALLVEVCPDGTWHPRHVQYGPDGTVRDVNLVVKDGAVREDGHAAAISWGDLHSARIDPVAAEAAFAPGGMLDTLVPLEQHVHDVLDFHGRGHHTRKDPHELFRLHVEGKESVEQELKETGLVLADQVFRTWCKTYIVDSNHDRHMTRWLAEADYRLDPLNAEVFLELQLAYYRAMRRKDRDFHLPEYALQEIGGAPKSMTFLREDASHVICEEYDGGIECALHGDRGVNGARGTPGGIARMGRKVNMADKHSAEIIDGVYVAGTLSNMDLGYNKGPGSWTQSAIVTYPNGVRAIFHIWRGKWRA